MSYPPEHILRLRVRGWMELEESPGEDYWIGTLTENGNWIWCSSRNDLYVPKEYRRVYAVDVCRHVNTHFDGPGAWFTGWIRGGGVFYLMWKDADGDIQIPIECDKPWIALRQYTLADWEKHANVAYSVYRTHMANMELSKNQQIKLAQGEKSAAAKA